MYECVYIYAHAPCGAVGAEAITRRILFAIPPQQQPGVAR